MTKKSMRRTIILVALVALAGGVYYWQSVVKTAPPAGLTEVKPVAADNTNSSGPHYAVAAPVAHSTDGDANAQKAPATVDESDAALEQSLSDLIGKEQFSSFLNKEDILRHFVVTVENAESPKLPSQFSPWKPVAGAFLVTDEGTEHFISKDNYKRYKPYVNLATSVDLKKLVAIYSSAYPLIQSAYEDLGTKAYFNDKFVEVIDHILEAPEVSDPVKVIPFSVSYRYADPKLEHSSAAQKIMLRMGPENARAVKARLRELRELLVHLDH